MRNIVKERPSGGYTVLKTGNAGNIINIAFARILDCVVTDIVLPVSGNGMHYSDMGKRLNISQNPGIILTAKTTIETRIEGLMSHKEGVHNKAVDTDELKIRISEFLIELEKLRDRYGFSPDSNSSGKSPEAEDKDFVKKLNQIIEENLTSFYFDVSVLHKKMGMTRGQIYRKVKALTGSSPGSLINRLRMQRAATLIHERAGNLAEISLSVGFANPSYFSRRFREFYGNSPKSFINGRKISAHKDN